MTGRAILRVGLTGGIASGKTTVAGFFAEMGALVLDADRIAHEMIRKGGEAHAEVVDRFGPAILDARGDVDRRLLGSIVFRDEEASLAKLRAGISAMAHRRAQENVHLVREVEDRLRVGPVHPGVGAREVAHKAVERHRHLEDQFSHFRLPSM